MLDVRKVSVCVTLLQMKSDYGAVGVIINNLWKGQIIIHTIENQKPVDGGHTPVNGKS